MNENTVSIRERRGVNKGGVLDSRSWRFFCLCKSGLLYALLKRIGKNAGWWSHLCGIKTMHSGLKISIKLRVNTQEGPERRRDARNPRVQNKLIKPSNWYLPVFFYVLVLAISNKKPNTPKTKISHKTFICVVLRTSGSKELHSPTFSSIRRDPLKPKSFKSTVKKQQLPTTRWGKGSNMEKGPLSLSMYG